MTSQLFANSEFKEYLFNIYSSLSISNTADQMVFATKQQIVIKNVAVVAAADVVDDVFRKQQPSLVKLSEY